MDDPTGAAYKVLAETLSRRGIDVSEVESRLRTQRVETPSWGYGTSGTRFAVFPQPGLPRDPFEKLDDAAQVHSVMGICPSVAIHIPWDRVDDYSALRQHAEAREMSIGAVNPNLFQEPQYRLGSIAHPDPDVRRHATEHLLECVSVAQQVDSSLLSLWFADGTNYPGQDSFIERRHRMLACLSEVYAAMPDSMRMLLEYKLYEPAFYHTDLADWGAALSICRKLGDHARVLVDLGHHAQGVNVEHIVALLLDEHRLGGFHFNGRKYGDDDLIVGSTNPLELFLIYVELARNELQARGQQIAYMIDQSHNIESKIEAMIMSVLNVQQAYARALLVNWEALSDAQHSGDVLAAYRIVLDAYETDVRPLCAKVRADLGAALDPIETFRQSGYLARVAEARQDEIPAGWTV